MNECNDKFQSKVEDQKWYKKRWTSPAERSGKQKKRFSPWKYATGSESRNIIPIMATLNTYPGGGYLGELGVNEEFSQMYAKYMIKYRWVDKYTRAVFLEFTLYNANLNLISVGTVMFEFFNFGGALPRAEIYVSRMYRSLVSEHKVFLVFDIIFFFYIFYALFREAKKLKRAGKSYFRSIDNLTNAFCVFLGIATMGAYAMRAISLGSKIDEYNESPDLFISFYQNAMYHELVAILMSLIDFIAIIKFIAFLQFNKNFLMLIQTIVRAAPRISYFIAYISIHMFGFVTFSYLLFGSERYNFSSMQRSVYSLNLLLLGVFDWKDFMSRPKMGPFFFMSYVVLMTFMLMNIFMTILMEIYAIVQMDEELAKREFKLVEFMIDSVKLSMGLKKPIGLGDEARMRKKDPYIHRLNRSTRSIETKKTPKLNKLLNKVYVDEFLEDIEMLCLEIMTHSDEFYELIPCSYKPKLEIMLRRGEIDYNTYCEFLNIPDEDRLSISTTVSHASQKTLNSTPSDFDTGSIPNSMVFLTEETDTISVATDKTSDDVEIELNTITEESYFEQYNSNTNDQLNPREESVLVEKHESGTIPEEKTEDHVTTNKESENISYASPEQSSLNRSYTSEDVSQQNPNLRTSSIDLTLSSSTAQLVAGGKRRKGKGKKERTQSKEEICSPHYQQQQQQHEYVNPAFEPEVLSSTQSSLSHKPFDVSFGNSNYHLNTNEYHDFQLQQQQKQQHEQHEQQQSITTERKMSIKIDLGESTTDTTLDQSQIASSRNLLLQSSNGATAGVVSARRKKRKKSTPAVKL